MTGLQNYIQCREDKETFLHLMQNTKTQKLVKQQIHESRKEKKEKVLLPTTPILLVGCTAIGCSDDCQCCGFKKLFMQNNHLLFGYYLGNISKSNHSVSIYF